MEGRRPPECGGEQSAVRLAVPESVWVDTEPRRRRPLVQGQHTPVAAAAAIARVRWRPETEPRGCYVGRCRHFAVSQLSHLCALDLTLSLATAAAGPPNFLFSDSVYQLVNRIYFGAKTKRKIKKTAEVERATEKEILWTDSNRPEISNFFCLPTAGLRRASRVRRL